MIPREVIVAALGNANVKAWLQVIRHRESDHTDRAYYRVNGRPDITSLAAHPYYGIPTTQGSRAAGAYQHLGTTWERIAERYPEDCKDFSVYAQDFAAVVGTSDRGALQDVIDGDIITACRKCHAEWTSLPGGSENTGFSVEQALEVFRQYGGGVVAEQPAAPIEDKSVPYQPPTGETTMGAIALPLLAQLLPQVFAMFSGRAQASISKATGADPAAAGQFMQSIIAQIGTAVGVPVTDDASATQAVAAVHSLPADKKAAVVAGLESYSLEQLTPVLDKLHGYSKDEWVASETSVAEARAANAEFMTPEQLKSNPAFIFGIAIIAMVFFVVFSVMWKDAIIALIGAIFKFDNLLKDVPGFSTDMQAFVIGAVVGSALTAVIQYFYGTNRQSAAKDATIQKLSGK